jgi:acetyltransferase-like isoleucine patch superfamily enzyme
MSRPESVMVHARGLCESDEVGEGTRVWAFAHVMAGARVGRRCNIGDHAFIESGAVLGDDVTIKNGVSVWDHVTLGDLVFVGPGVTFTNEHRPRVERHRAEGGFEAVPTRVEARATLGAASIILCGVTVGEGAFVSAGALVTRDVPAYARVVGTPARFAAWVCGCGRDLDEDLACTCGRRFEPAPDEGAASDVGLRPCAAGDGTGRRS